MKARDSRLGSQRSQPQLTPAYCAMNNSAGAEGLQLGEIRALPSEGLGRFYAWRLFKAREAKKCSQRSVVSTTISVVQGDDLCLPMSPDNETRQPIGG